MVFYIKRNLLTIHTCKYIISQLNEIKTDMKIPHMIFSLVMGIL